MGTRADFYVGRGTTAEWLGSVPFDGYPSGINLNDTTGAPPSESRVLSATTEAEYRAAVAEFLAGTRNATLPEMGWPWPWTNSQTTDYAYAFDAGVVYGSCFGHPWFIATKEPEDHDEATPTVFPQMDTDRAALSGRRSGLMVVTATSRGLSVE